MTMRAQIVIAVHDPARPLQRAIDSVLDGVGGEMGVVVVCHGIGRASFGEINDPRVRWVEFQDGIRSPAGPFNAGIAAATAPYVGVMGSDDFFDPGGTHALLARLDSTPDVLIYPMRHQTGASLPNPLSRRGRRRRLDPVRDRLSYRTAPLALVRTELIRTLGLHMSPGLRTGEDVEFSARLWFSDHRIDFYPDDPAYVIGADGPARVTHAAMPITDELAAFERLFSQPWVRALARSRRASLVTKTVRVHLLGSVWRHVAQGTMTDEVRAHVSHVIRQGVEVSPSALAPLARHDRAVIDALWGPGTTMDVIAAVSERGATSRWERYLTRNPLLSLHREGDLRRALRYRTWPT
tara:strand:- start:7010 stop:8065 length:1056 start_codon:yes stop_codon:yes gene_type:complete